MHSLVNNRKRLFLSEAREKRKKNHNENGTDRNCLWKSQRLHCSVCQTFAPAENDIVTTTWKHYKRVWKKQDPGCQSLCSLLMAAMVNCERSAGKIYDSYTETDFGACGQSLWCYWANVRTISGALHAEASGLTAQTVSLLKGSTLTTGGGHHELRRGRGIRLTCKFCWHSELLELHLNTGAARRVCDSAALTGLCTDLHWIGNL